jgi:hypothetical protein
MAHHQWPNVMRGFELSFRRAQRRRWGGTVRTLVLFSEIVTVASLSDVFVALREQM